MTKKILAIVTLTCMASILMAQAERNYSSGQYFFTYPENFVGIEETADAFNAIRSSFNDIFKFDPDSSNRMNKIVILPDKAAFEAYIEKRVGEPRNQYLFLKYGKPELSELVIYPKELVQGYAAFAGTTLNRQLFLQFLYEYVSEPPLWVRDGFQAYFEQISYDAASHATRHAVYSPWLETAKSYNSDVGRKLDPSAILSAVTGSYEAVRFYPQAWAFAAFLVNSENESYQRFLHETCVLLEGIDGRYNDETQQGNTDRVKNRFDRFSSPEKAEKDFSVWLAGQHTFNELVQIGVDRYSAGAYSASRKTLLEAVAIRENDPLVTYYLGLVSYAEKDYASAELWYRKSLEYGGEISTINWALGLNAFSDKRYSEAKVYLETASSANPERYGTKVTNLVNSMPK